ncbi:MAG: AI-2E family transporter [Pirellulaceae bacterium]|nr:AI-2E family transporter [Planctomycetales bacterium]
MAGPTSVESFPINQQMMSGVVRGASAQPHSIKEIDLRTVSLVVLAVIATFAAMYMARDVLFPILLAGVLAFPLLPLVRTLVRLRVPRFVAATAILILALTTVTVGAIRLFEPATTWVQDAPRQMREVETKLRTLRGPWQRFQEASRSVEEMTDSPDASKLKVEVAAEPLSDRVMWLTQKLAIGAVVTVCLLFLLLALGDNLVDTVVNLQTSDESRKHWRGVMHRVETMISNYLLTYSMINAGLGTIIGLGLWWIGMPNPMLWGVMAALLNFIPYAGLFAGTIIVTLVGLLTFDSASHALLAPAIYLAANGIEANAVTPILLGRSMCLSPIIIFLSVVVWGWMWGIGGALIAVPLLVVIKVLCDHFPPLSHVGRILGSRSTARQSVGWLRWRCHASCD